MCATLSILFSEALLPSLALSPLCPHAGACDYGAASGVFLSARAHTHAGDNAG